MKDRFLKLYLRFKFLLLKPKKLSFLAENTTIVNSVFKVKMIKKAKRQEVVLRYDYYLN